MPNIQIILLCKVVVTKFLYMVYLRCLCFYFCWQYHNKILTNNKRHQFLFRKKNGDKYKSTCTFMFKCLTKVVRAKVKVHVSDVWWTQHLSTLGCKFSILNKALYKLKVIRKVVCNLRKNVRFKLASVLCLGCMINTLSSI